jgi:hypothetical protein
LQALSPYILSYDSEGDPSIGFGLPALKTVMRHRKALLRWSFQLPLQLTITDTDLSNQDLQLIREWAALYESRHRGISFALRRVPAPVVLRILYFSGITKEDGLDPLTRFSIFVS